MTPGRTPPAGSSVSPVRAPVEDVWPSRFLEESRATISAIKSRHQQRARRGWRFFKRLLIDNLWCALRVIYGLHGLAVSFEVRPDTQRWVEMRVDIASHFIGASW